MTQTIIFLGIVFLKMNDVEGSDALVYNGFGVYRGVILSPKLYLI